MVLRVATQIVPGCQYQPALLVVIHRGQSAAMAGIAAPAHFRENQGVAVLHDQVDFPLAAAEVSEPAKNGRPREITAP